VRDIVAVVVFTVVPLTTPSPQSLKRTLFVRFFWLFGLLPKKRKRKGGKGGKK